MDQSRPATTPILDSRSSLSKGSMWSGRRDSNYEVLLLKLPVPERLVSTEVFADSQKKV